MTSSRHGEGRIKGAAFREFLRWLESDFGKERVVAVARALPEETLGVLDPEGEALGVLSASWYPAAAVHALLDGLVGDLDAAERDRIAGEGARAVMRTTLRGVYKLLFDWMATPKRYAKFSGKLWGSYYDSGEFDVAMPDATTAVCTIRDWRGHHGFICDLNREAAAAIYEAMGCRDVRVQRVECVDRGDPHCRFVTRWSGPGAGGPA